MSGARHHLDALFETAGGSVPDTLVLGCTHFPMLAGAIGAAIGPAVCMVDSAATTAMAVSDRPRQARAYEPG